MQLVLIAGITVIVVALPAVGRELGATRSDLALVTAAYGLSFGGLLILGGRLADLLGRRRTFLTGVVVFGLGSVASALAPGLGWLVGARFAQGIGAALVAPSALALLGAIYPDPRRRARMLAVWGGVNGIGATLGTLLSGVVVTYVSWRWSFALPAAVALVVAVLARRVLPAPPPRPARLDLTGAVLITAGVSAVSYGFLRAGERPWSSPVVYGGIGAGVLVLLAFLVREGRSAAPLLPRAYFASWRRVTGVLGIFVMAGGMSTTVFLLSLFFQQDLGYSPLRTSAAFLPYGVVQVGAGLFAGRIVSRFGMRTVTASGALAVALGLVSISTTTPALVLAGLLVFAFGAALVFAGAMVAAVDDVPDSQAGVSGGVVNTAMETGPTIGFAVLLSLGGLAFDVAAAAFVLTAALAVVTLEKGKH
ncbi:MFS transporter [Flindersiella endophytica]